MEELTYRCIGCKKAYDSITTLQSHCNRKHEKGVDRVCGECRKVVKIEGHPCFLKNSKKINNTKEVVEEDLDGDSLFGDPSENCLTKEVAQEYFRKVPKCSMDKIKIAKTMENLLETFKKYLGSEESGAVIEEKQRVNLTKDTKTNMVSSIRSFFRYLTMEYFPKRWSISREEILRVVVDSEEFVAKKFLL